MGWSCPSGTVLLEPFFLNNSAGKMARSPVAKTHYIGMLRLKPPGLTPMPVTLDLLARTPHSELSETDPPDLFRLAQDMRPCPCFQAAWVAWQSDNLSVWLYAARFNGRIVGAAFVQRDCMRSLGVRAITRGRGVGHRIVSVLVQRHQFSLSVHMHPELSAFVSACLASSAGPR